MTHYLGQIFQSGELIMVKNKLSERLSKILNKEISQIEVPISNPTNENEQSLNHEELNKEEIKSDASFMNFPVFINDSIPVIALFNSFADMKSPKVKSILSNTPIKYEYNIIPAIAANLSENQITQLSAIAEVDIIGFDEYVTIQLDTARKWFEVDTAVETFHVTGNEGNPRTFTKRDNTIAIIDTGIDINHVDLSSGKVIGWFNALDPTSTTPFDDNGHGTHVASIAAGLGKALWNYRGVAYGAALVGVKVFDASGSGNNSDVIAGIQWCVANKSTYGIKIINMSLGGPPDAALRAATNAAINNGIVVVCAAGNSGPGLNTIGSPGDTPAAITVGNMADVGKGGYFLVRSSSRGPIFDGSIKPDLVAPGYRIIAAKAGTTNQYIDKTGTSMASPFVAGVVALILDLNGSLTPAQVKRILTETAQPWGNGRPNNDYGYGRLQAFKAICKAYRLPGSKWYSHSSTGFPPAGPTKPYCYEPNIHCECPCPPMPVPFKELIQPNHFSEHGTIALPSTIDWYEFYVTKLGYPAALTLLTTSAVPGTDVEITVYNSSKNPIATFTSTSREEFITFIPVYYGKYLISITRTLGNPVSYQLDLSVFGEKLRWYETT